MSRFSELTRSQLRARAKLLTAVWLSWLFVGQYLAHAVPDPVEIPLLLAAMVPFVLAGRFGLELWFRAKTAPELPRATVYAPARVTAACAPARRPARTIER